MADTHSNLRDNSARLRRNVSKIAFRSKEKVMRSIGRAEETKDEILEHYVMLINKQQLQMLKLQRDMKQYLTALRAMSLSHKAFYTSLYEIYDNDWAGKDVIASLSQRSQLLNDDIFARFQSEVTDALQHHLNEYNECKFRVEKRGRKLVDYDAARRTLQSLQAAKKPDHSKIEKAEEHVNQAQETYETLNNQLHEQLPTLYDSRLPVCVSTFSSICESERAFSTEVAEMKSKLNNVLLNLKSAFDVGEYHIQRMRPPLDNGRVAPPATPGAAECSPSKTNEDPSLPPRSPGSMNNESPKSDASAHEYVNLQVGTMPDIVKPVTEDEENNTMQGQGSTKRKTEDKSPKSSARPVSMFVASSSSPVPAAQENRPKDDGSGNKDIKKTSAKHKNKSATLDSKKKENQGGKHKGLFGFMGFKKHSKGSTSSSAPTSPSEDHTKIVIEESEEQNEEPPPAPVAVAVPAMSDMSSKDEDSSDEDVEKLGAAVSPTSAVGAGIVVAGMKSEESAEQIQKIQVEKVEIAEMQQTDCEAPAVIQDEESRKVEASAQESLTSDEEDMDSMFSKYVGKKEEPTIPLQQDQDDDIQVDQSEMKEITTEKPEVTGGPQDEDPNFPVKFNENPEPSIVGVNDNKISYGDVERRISSDELERNKLQGKSEAIFSDEGFSKMQNTDASSLDAAFATGNSAHLGFNEEYVPGEDLFGSQPFLSVLAHTSATVKPQDVEERVQSSDDEEENGLMKEENSTEAILDSQNLPNLPGTVRDALQDEKEPEQYESKDISPSTTEGHSIITVQDVSSSVLDPAPPSKLGEDQTGNREVSDSESDKDENIQKLPTEDGDHAETQDTSSPQILNKVNIQEETEKYTARLEEEENHLHALEERGSVGHKCPVQYENVILSSEEPQEASILKQESLDKGSEKDEDGGDVDESPDDVSITSSDVTIKDEDSDADNHESAILKAGGSLGESNVLDAMEQEFSKPEPQSPTSKKSNGDGAVIHPIYEEPPNEEDLPSYKKPVAVPAPSSPPPKSPTKSVDSHRYLDLPPDYLFSAQALYQYRSTDEDELSFEKGEIIHIIQHPDPEEQDEGWQMGIRQKAWEQKSELESNRGVFPENFTKRIQL